LKNTGRPTPCGPIPPPSASRRHIVTHVCDAFPARVIWEHRNQSLPTGAANMTTLSTTARSAIVSSYVKALNAHEPSGSLVTQVCETAMRYMKGEEIPEDDRKAIVADIARAKGWKGKSAKSRISECNVILKAYAKLGEALEAFSAKAKRVQWHD